MRQEYGDARQIINERTTTLDQALITICRLTERMPRLTQEDIAFIDPAQQPWLEGVRSLAHWMKDDPTPVERESHEAQVILNQISDDCGLEWEETQYAISPAQAMLTAAAQNHPIITEKNLVYLLHAYVDKNPPDTDWVGMNWLKQMHHGSQNKSTSINR